MDGLGELNLDLKFEDLEFTEEENTPQPAANADGDEDKNPNEDNADNADGADNAKNTDNVGESTDGESQERVGENTGGDGEEEHDSPQLYSTLANTLIEKGVLTAVDSSKLDDVKDADAFIELMKKEIAAQELKDLTPAQREVVTGIREGMDTDTASKFKDAMEKIDNISIDSLKDNVDVRRDLIFQDYMAKGFSKEAAIKQVNRSIKLNTDIEDAAEAHASLKTMIKAQFDKAKEDAKRQAEEEAQKAEKEKERLKEELFKKDQYIKGIDLPDNVKKEIYEEMMENVSINPITKEPENAMMKFQREHPEEYTKRLYTFWKLTNGFTDTKYFTRKTKTSTIKDLERAIKNSATVQGGGDTVYTDDNSSLLDIQDIVI